MCHATLGPNDLRSTPRAGDALMTSADLIRTRDSAMLLLIQCLILRGPSFPMRWRVRSPRYHGVDGNRVISHTRLGRTAASLSRRPVLSLPAGQGPSGGSERWAWPQLGPILSGHLRPLRDGAGSLRRRPKAQ